MAGQGSVSVLGAFLVDLTCRTSRMPGWGETIHGGAFSLGPGGKGSNQAVAAARQKAPTSLITRLGKDPFGDMAGSLFAAEGINAACVSIDERLPTGTATIMVDTVSGENAIIIVPSACDALGPDEVDAAEQVIAASSHFVSQLELPLSTCTHGMRLARRHGVKVVLNPAPAIELPDEVLPLVDYLTPNEGEAAALTGRSVGDDAATARVLRDRGVRNVVLTLGPRGVFVSGDGQEAFVPAFDAGPVVDTTGAGDAFNGGFVAALAQGRGLLEAARFGCAVAALSVTRPGATSSMPSRDDVDALLKGA